MEAASTTLSGLAGSLVGLSIFENYDKGFTNLQATRARECGEKKKKTICKEGT